MTLTDDATPEAAVPSVLLPPLASPDYWDDQDEAVLVCRAVLDITHDIKSFVFEPRGDRTFQFEAGQFLTLRLTIDGQQINRCYTISSPPTRPYRVAITVKRVPGGPVSNWLHDNVRAGSEITALAPLGAFTLSRQPATKYLFLSAGSGITPLMSMTRTLHDIGSDADIVFVHSARTPDDIVFRDELAALEAVTPNLRVAHVCENDYPSQSWSGLRGRLSADMLQALVPDLHERVTFTCGPALYMASVRGILAELGYDPQSYHEESFSFDQLRDTDPTMLDDGELADLIASPGPDDTSAASTTSTYAVEFVRSGKTVQCGPDENVLDAALAAGLRLPSSCTLGMCGTCKVSKLAGEVDMNHNGGIRPREIDQGKILICCSKPLSDLTIDG
ncbi:MAG: glycine betaine catabolism [Nocardioidaceae bacterium]|jgi:ferredoxin-NADP reductase|nr:glycine betaine catabolism [Nocardioidaceae bacterium]